MSSRAVTIYQWKRTWLHPGILHFTLYKISMWSFRQEPNSIIIFRKRNSIFLTSKSIIQRFNFLITDFTFFFINSTTWTKYITKVTNRKQTQFDLLHVIHLLFWHSWEQQKYGYFKWFFFERMIMEHTNLTRIFTIKLRIVCFDICVTLSFVG